MKTSTKKFAFLAIASILLLSCSLPGWVPFFGDDDDDEETPSSSSKASTYFCRISNTTCIEMPVDDCMAIPGSSVVSTCGGNQGIPSSSSATVNPEPNPPNPPQGPNITIKDLTVYGLTSNAGGSFVDLDAGIVSMMAQALSANASKIDIVYEGSYIYTAYGIKEERGYALLNDWTIIIPLEGRIAQTAREVLSNNANGSTIESFYSDLLYYINSNRDVDKISAAENTAFVVISSEGNSFVAKVSSKNGIESIKLTFSILPF